MHRAHLTLSYRSALAAALTSLGLLVGCTGSVDSPGGGNGTPGAGAGPGVGTGGSTGGPVAGAPGTGAGGPVTVDPACAGTDLPATKRIVRLSFNQVANSIGALIDAALGTKISTDFELLDSEHRAFPPLQSPREGNSLTDQSWGTIDQIASSVGKYVFDNFATVTGCGAMPTDACATEYLNKFAQKAYRRPLTAEEQTRVTALYNNALKTDAGATINEAVQYSVYGILSAPQFLYRTEFGDDWKVNGGLTSYEFASMLSFFLTDSLPDPELLTAASQNKLSTPADVGAQVDRILLTEGARRNFRGAMISYFSYPNLESQIIQDDAFTGAMRQSMFQEAQLFLDYALWGGGKLSELLVSRKGFVNATLAPLYGIQQFPPAGATLDANMFAQVELSADRTGMLTQAGFLANRSRPNGTSVVGRGLLVKGAFLCTETPPPPASIGEDIDRIAAENPNATERKLAEIRGTTSPCSGCHQSFDAYGLALDTFDVLGRYRAMDAEGRPIDPSVTLPAQIGGQTAKDIVEVGKILSENGSFAKCMGKNLVNYAYADVSSGSATIEGCAADNIGKAFAGSDQSFSSLVKAVATSVAFGNRSKGLEGVAQ
jgi:Protein of unknown function (DUF1592)/Protein of unknown function (DUF1588)/Protein of unknown function (DUF1595)/Protein of unknown function (DUF1585)